MFQVVCRTRRFGYAQTRECVIPDSDTPDFADADALAKFRALEHAHEVMVGDPELVCIGSHRVRPTAYSSVTYVVREIA